VSAGNYFQSVRDVRDTRPLGFYGQFTRNSNFLSITGSNQDPQLVDIWTITVPASPDDSQNYVITIDGVATATYFADATSTQAEVGAGLEAAFNASPGCRAKATAAYAAGTITLTGEWPGVAFVPTVNSADTTQDLGVPSNSQAAADADVVPFGRVVATDGYVTNEGNPKVFVPKTSHFTAQVITITTAGNTASYYSGDVTVNGKTYVWGGVVWDTNLTTTNTAIAAAINAVLPAETVIAAGTATTVTLTAEVEGAEFDATMHAVGHADAEATKVYTTGPSISTSLLRAMVGISVRRLDVENQTLDGDDPAYAAAGGIEVAKRCSHGIVQRDTTETWTFGGDLFVSLATAAKGRLYNTAGTDRVWIGSSKIRVLRQEPSTSTDGLAVISLDMGA